MISIMDGKSPRVAFWAQHVTENNVWFLAVNRGSQPGGGSFFLGHQ